VSAALGARVAVAEERRLGGTCVNVGCIPKKLLVYAAHVSDELLDASAYGWSIPGGSFDWPALIRSKDLEIERLNDVYDRLLEAAGIERFAGRARLVDAHTVAVGERRFRAEHVLVATGAWPYLPALPGIEHAISSNEAFYLEKLPQRVVIVGGGYIAAEFAGIFHGLGVHTTQLYRGERFLRGFDDDVRLTLAEQMRKRGVDLRFGAEVARLERGAAGVRVELADGSALEADQVMFATGRRPLTADLGLEAVGVTLDRGAIVVDAYSRTSVPGIWAIGDVTDRLQLTPVAIHEAMALAQTLFGGRPTRPDHADVASAVFSAPPVGTVGLTEAQARARYGEVRIYRTRFRPLRHTLTGRDEQTMMKLVVDGASDRVVGAHMVGADAPEIIQGVAIAVKLGATKAQFDQTVGIHPTAAEEFVTLREPVTA
jgi:glutathione reductase (NADPH)